MSKFHFGILASLFAERVPKDLRIKIKEGDENKKNIKKSNVWVLVVRMFKMSWKIPIGRLVLRLLYIDVYTTQHMYVAAF